MARLEYIEHRLVNWARWKLGRSVSYARPNVDGMPRRHGGFEEAPVPVSDCEASETDDAIATLDDTLQLTVHVAYLGGGNEADRLRKLGVSKVTMHERVRLAHRKLASYFTDKAERGRTERERVEGLQKVARP